MSRQIVAGEQTGKIALMVWISILVLTGTYFRTREVDAIPKTDWLVVLQLLGGCLGIAFGTALIAKHKCGLGGRAVLAWVIAAAGSAVFSAYWTVVLGYWVVLAGAYLLTVGLVARSKQQEALKQIEYACFLTLSAILLKDTVIALAYPDPDAPDDQLFRLGMGLTHANLMSVLAAIAFWMSFRNDDARARFVVWPARFLFIAIMLLSRTRIAIVGLLIAGTIRWVIQYSYAARIKGYLLLIAIPCWLLAGGVLWAWASSLDIEVVGNVNQAFNRGEDSDTIMSISGRTDIWSHALQKIYDSPLPQLLFGHGFGMSRFILNDGHGGETDFFAAHAHNSLLEIVLSMGILGAIPFVVTAFYGLGWLTNFSSLQETFSLAFSLRAISAICIILIASVTEPFLGGKLGPVAMIYVFYVTALDQRERIAG